MKIRNIIIPVLVCLIALVSIEYSILKKANTLADEANQKANDSENVLENTLEEIKKEEERINSLNEQFNVFLEDVAKENDVVGMSVVVFKDGKILDSFNYGYGDVSNNIKTDDNTKYRIASISKVVTAIGLMRLYDEGLFKLDDKIDDVLNIDAYGDVTFKHLLTHTSGLYDSDTFYLAAASTHLSLEYVVKNSFSNYAPGQHYEYTNFGMASVGAIIEHLTGEYFIDYMRDIFEELNIDAGYTADTIDDVNSIAKLYEGGEINDPKTWIKNSDFYKGYGLGNNYLAGAGDLIISASDLAKIAMALCNEGNYNGVQLLSKEATKLMLTDNFEYYDYSGNYKYTEGLSCHNFKGMVKGREIHGHTGSAYGVKTAMYFDPTDKTGVVILDNGASTYTNDEGYNSLLYAVVNETYNLYFN